MKKNDGKKKTSPTQKANASELNKEVGKSTDMITSLIHEYLLKKDYQKTLDVFQEEVSTKIKNKVYYKPSFQEINDSYVLKSFSTGDKAEFFKQWNRIIPSHIKMKDIAFSKLEFFIEIYFAIFPILGEKKQITPQQQKELKNNMEDFKKYLETKEIELSKTTEFLAYYALPYVPNPKEHPSYQQLFSEEWLRDLKEKIRQCIKNYLPSMKYPVLYDVVTGAEEAKMEEMRNYLSSLGGEKDMSQNLSPSQVANNTALESEVTKLKEDLEKLKLKEEKSKIAFGDSQRTWTNLALNIISYSFEVVSLYRNLRNDDPQIDKINAKLTKYHKFLKKNYEELEKNKNNNNSNLLIRNEDIEKINNSKYDESLQSQANIVQNENAKMMQKDSNTINNRDQTINQSQKEIFQQENIDARKSIQVDYEISYLLDMKRISLAINHKIQTDDNNLLFILREIRLRIFRRSDAHLRQLTLYSVFYYDLFGTLSKTSNTIHSILSNQILNLEAMKLLNSIASLNKGRNYLLAKSTLIDDIVQCMIREKTDTDLRQNCLGTIQKFTLRAGPQNRLIELNVIHYLIDVFTYEAKTLSDYTVEYGLALIMNLSLRKAGREKFENDAERILQILLNFMKKDSVQVLTCINGTLYSLLKRQKFKNEARKFGLENILKNNNNQNPQLKKQILYILEELNNPPEQEQYDENFEEDSNAKDDDEISFDEYTDLDSIDETLLEEHYRILGDFIIRNSDLNKIEEQKITKFMHNNPTMSEGIINKSTLNSISQSRPEDIDRPLRRPTTPITNLSMTGNSQLFNDKKSIQVKGSEYSNNILQGDTAKAFATKDKLTRTPPREYNK